MRINGSAFKWIVCALVLCWCLYPQEALAQENYPGEYVLVGFTVNAEAKIVSASNCYPYARGCLGIDDPPVVVSHLVRAGLTNDVSLNRGFARYFPFTPCLLRLPFPYADQRDSQDLGVSIASLPDSPLASKNVEQIQLFPASLLSPECDFALTSYQELLLSEQPTPAPDYLSFHIRLGRYIPQIPGNPTAVYGYSRGYMGGNRFHEGFDTSWRYDPTANVIVIPMPSSPFFVRGGWFMNIAPCALQQNMFGLRDESLQSFSEAMEALENGNAPPGLDCAFLFGGFHIATELDGPPTSRAALEMNLPPNKGKLPWEIGLFVPADYVGGICATVSGYAGDFAPHCHYQASIVPGEVVRQWMREMRKNPSEFIRSPSDLINLRNRDWGGLWSDVYRYSIDPILLLFPDITAVGLQAGLAHYWKEHPWPEMWAKYLESDSMFPGAFWDNDSTADYIIGVNSDPEGVIEQTRGAECAIRDKTIPGCYCRPRQGNYYNTDNPDHSREMVARTEARIIRPLWAYVCAKRSICPDSSSVRRPE